jgi:hypothetical protein
LVVAKSRVSIERFWPLGPLGPLTVDFAELADASPAARDGRAVFFGAALRAGFFEPFGGRFWATVDLLVSDGGPHPNGRTKRCASRVPPGTRLALSTA